MPLESHTFQNNQIMRDIYNELHNKCNYIEKSEHKRKRVGTNKRFILEPTKFCF